MAFRIHYTSSRTPVRGRDARYEGYDLESAFYDYQPEGIGATIELGGYSLELREPVLKLIDLVRSCLPLAEQLRSRPPETPPDLRRFLPDLPTTFKLYHWVFADFMLELPYLLFATDGAVVRIYTRTRAEADELTLVVWKERDREQPVELPVDAVVREIAAFLTTYLDDLASALTFIRSDRLYQDYRNRIAQLLAWHSDIR